MRTTLEFDTASANEFSRRLREAGERAHVGMRGAGRELREEFAANERQVWATNGASIGAAWAPLSQAYAKRKRGGELMVDRHLLVNSLTRPGAPYAVYRATEDSIDIGTRRPGAQRLNRQRRFIGVTPTHAQRMWGIVGDFLFGGIADSTWRRQ